MLRTGSDYLSALRDGRRIYLGGERVNDVVSHPALGETARSFAAIYDRKLAPDQREAMSAGRDASASSVWFSLPKSKEDLRKRWEGHRRVAEWSHGLFGRSPDHVASFIAGLAMKPELFDSTGKGFGQNLSKFFEHIKSNDLFASYCVVAPQGSRDPALYHRRGQRGPALEVIEENARGVVLSGVKMLGTAAVFSDVAWIGNLLPLASDQSRQAITCAVPINSTGLSIWVRAVADRAGSDSRDRPFSRHFDESDGVLVFENVEVPWENVFLLDDVTLSREIYFETPSHVMGNHQATIRFHEKLIVLLGIGYKAAEMNDVLQVQAVRDNLAKLAAAEAGLRGMIAGSIEDAEEVEGGYLQPNGRAVYAALLWCTTNYQLLAEMVRELLGAGPFQMPADSSFMADPMLHARFEKLWVGPSGTATERFRFMKTAWDYLGSELATRHAQYERFYAGPQFVHTQYNFGNCPWANYKLRIERVMDSLTLPGAHPVPLAG